MDESLFRKWTFRLQCVSMAVIVIGGAIALWRYFDTTANEFKRPFWEKQIDLYVQASDAAATLAVAQPGAEWERAKLRFLVLYNGSLAIVEDKAIDSAMVRFKGKLEAFEQDPTPDTREEMRKASLSLAHSFKESLAKDWKRKLRDMKGVYNR